jgi:hypothetical protein
MIIVGQFSKLFTVRFTICLEKVMEFKVGLFNFKVPKVPKV